MGAGKRERTSQRLCRGGTKNILPSKKPAYEASHPGAQHPSRTRPRRAPPTRHSSCTRLLCHRIRELSPHYSLRTRRVSNALATPATSRILPYSTSSPCQSRSGRFPPVSSCTHTPGTVDYRKKASSIWICIIHGLLRSSHSILIYPGTHPLPLRTPRYLTHRFTVRLSHTYLYFSVHGLPLLFSFTRSVTRWPL